MSKLSQMDELSSGDLSLLDELYIRDVSEDPADESKRVTLQSISDLIGGGGESEFDEITLYKTGTPANTLVAAIPVAGDWANYAELTLSNLDGFTLVTGVMRLAFYTDPAVEIYFDESFNTYFHLSGDESTIMLNIECPNGGGSLEVDADGDLNISASNNIVLLDPVVFNAGFALEGDPNVTVAIGANGTGPGGVGRALYVPNI